MTADPLAPVHRGQAGLRRNVLLVPRPGGIRADVEDDYHEFGLDLSVERDTITAVRTDAGRTPWSRCGDAGGFLGERLTGLTLDQADAVGSPLLHCTHQLDLALIAAAHVHDERPTLFEMYVGDVADGRRLAELSRNGRLELSWQIERATFIVDPPAFAGRDLKALREWQALLDPRLRETARMLRRAAFIALGRGVAVDRFDAAALNRMQAGACYNFQPERIGRSVWQIERRRDFTDAAHAPLAPRMASLASAPPHPTNARSMT